MGGGLKKEFREADGLPVLAWGLKTMLETELFDYGLITCTPGLQKKTMTILEPFLTPERLNGLTLFFCDGGTERQQSVHYGLEHLAEREPVLFGSGIVLIHDGARPWVSTGLVSSVFAGTVRHRACAPVVPSTDAMKKVDHDGRITEHLPRKETVSIQTPQGFIFSEILEAHRSASADGLHYIDDTEIYHRYVGQVYTVPGERKNSKITFSEDI